MGVEEGGRRASTYHLAHVPAVGAPHSRDAAGSVKDNGSIK
jgi:hypothetical protein